MKESFSTLTTTHNKEHLKVALRCSFMLLYDVKFRP